MFQCHSPKSSHPLPLLSQFFKHIVTKWFWNGELPSVREKKVASTAVAILHQKCPYLL